MKIKEIFRKAKVKITSIFIDTRALPEAQEQKAIMPFYVQELQINDNLTEEERKLVDKYKGEIDFDSLDSIMLFASETFKKSNNLSDAFRWHIYRISSLVEKTRRTSSIRDITRLELEKVIHKQDAFDMLEGLEKIERETELRLIAIQEKGKEREKEHKLFGARTKKSDIGALTNSGDRLKINLTSLKFIKGAIKNEIEINGLDKITLENIFAIIDSASKEDRKNIMDIISEYYTMSARQIDILEKITGKDMDFGISYLNKNSPIEANDLKEYISNLLLARKKIEICVEDNREKLLEYLPKAKDDVEKISETFEDMYLYYPVWAKRIFPSVIDSYLIDDDPYGYRLSSCT